MAKRGILKDKDGNRFYPETRDVCVKCGDKTLPDKLSELSSKTGSVGYVSCTTASATAAKIITLTGVTALTTGIRLLVKMDNSNTASNATLNINSLGAKPLYYNNVRASGDNTWDTGEVIEVYYDGTNFYSSNVLGGVGNGGNKVIEWHTDVATTRKQVKQKDRKGGMQISYKNDENEWVNEQYIGDDFTDAAWVKDYNWNRLANVEQLLQKTVLLGVDRDVIPQKSGIRTDGNGNINSGIYNLCNPIKLRKGETISIDNISTDYYKLFKYDKPKLVAGEKLTYITDNKKEEYIADENCYIVLQFYNVIPTNAHIYNIGYDVKLQKQKEEIEKVVDIERKRIDNNTEFLMNEESILYLSDKYNRTSVNFYKENLGCITLEAIDTYNHTDLTGLYKSKESITGRGIYKVKAFDENFKRIDCRKMILRPNHQKYYFKTVGVKDIPIVGDSLSDYANVYKDRPGWTKNLSTALIQRYGNIFNIKGDRATHGDTTAGQLGKLKSINDYYKSYLAETAAFVIYIGTNDIVKSYDSSFDKSYSDLITEAKSMTDNVIAVLPAYCRDTETTKDNITKYIEAMKRILDENSVIYLDLSAISELDAFTISDEEKNRLYIEKQHIHWTDAAWDIIIPKFMELFDVMIEEELKQTLMRSRIAV